MLASRPDFRSLTGRWRVALTPSSSWFYLRCKQTPTVHWSLLNNNTGYTSWRASFSQGIN